MPGPGATWPLGIPGSSPPFLQTSLFHLENSHGTSTQYPPPGMISSRVTHGLAQSLAWGMLKKGWPVSEGGGNRHHHPARLPQASPAGLPSAMLGNHMPRHFIPMRLV